MVAMIVAFALLQPAPGIVTLARGSYSQVADRTERAARTQDEWQALWKLHGASQPAATVDFAKEMIAAVFLGTRPTGGYDVEIVATRREANAVVVEYVEHRPPADAIVTQALTSPFHIVKLPRTDGPVRFRDVSPPAAAR
jgi:hypothetical protein